MPNYFSQYSGAAGGYADQYGIPQSVFFGLIQQESSWNPNAAAGTTSAYGFGQLTRGTAASLGVNPYDPLQNLQGSAQYLASMPGSTWTEKLAHYYQGPHANIGQSGLDYANSVLNKAKKYFGLDPSSLGDAATTAASAASCAAGDPMACLSMISGSNGSSCGTLDFVCKLQQWVSKSEFFTRLALATLALLFILGGLYLMKDRS